jgi:hypothetical protein
MISCKFPTEVLYVIWIKFALTCILTIIDGQYLWRLCNYWTGYISHVIYRRENFSGSRINTGSLKCAVRSITFVCHMPLHHGEHTRTVFFFKAWWVIEESYLTLKMKAVCALETLRSITPYRSRTSHKTRYIMSVTSLSCSRSLNWGLEGGCKWLQCAQYKSGCTS